MLNFFKNKIGFLGVFYFILLFFYLLSQFVFLSADSDLIISGGSRGGWTDEGLNTIQIRNWVSHYHFNLMDCDNFLKTPLFSLFLFPFFKVFGVNFLMSRSLTHFFCLSLFCVFYFNKKTNIIGVTFVLTTMTLLPIHQYSHMCLAEMYSSMLLVISALILSFHKNDKVYFQFVVLFLILLIVVLFKIQFIYVLLIPLIMSLIGCFYYSDIFNRSWMKLSFGFLIIIIVCILFLWILPFKKEWLMVSKQQSGGILLDSINFDLIWRNIRANFIGKRYFLFSFLFFISLIVAIKGLLKRQYSKEYVKLLLFCLSWFILELHKLTLDYLPIRYLLSFYLSMGFFISIVIGYYLNNNKFKLITTSSIFCLICINSFFYYKAYSERTYTVKKLNLYFQKQNNKNDVVIGSWAPAFNWESKSLAFPIWNDFLGEREVFKYYSPDFIVSEINQEDSDSVYLKRGIKLDKCCQTLMTTKVAFWYLNIYKVKKITNVSHKRPS